MVFIRLKPAKTEEMSLEAQINILGAFAQIGKQAWWKTLIGSPRKNLSLELISIEQKSHFYLVAPQGYESYFEGQILSQYPKTLILHENEDPLETVFAKSWRGAFMKMTAAYAFPIKTFKDAGDTDLLANIWGVLGKMTEGDAAAVQLVLQTTNQGRWQNRFRAAMKYTDREGKEITSPYNSLYTQKLNSPLMQMQLRIVVGSLNRISAQDKVNELTGAFGTFQKAEGNGLAHHFVNNWHQNGFELACKHRRFWFWQPAMVLNLDEIASLWHMADLKSAQVRGIDWGKTLVSEAPDNLPVAEMNQDESVKRTINFFAQTEWRNHSAIFGINKEDRRKHMYIIGKTGTGKSTLLTNMAINDIRNGEGVAIIDPHGDSAEMILDYIPKRRINDVVYLDPTLSNERAFALNLFDNTGAAHTDVVASGIVSVLYKLYYNSWGPRLEYILRNTILSLLYYKQANFTDVPRLLTDARFRKEVVTAIAPIDPILTNFWNNEFDQMNDKMRVESISPILNKVGQFLSAQRIRHIVGTQQSSFSFSEIMDNKKILIINLSQGKLGEDTAALLGAMFITKMQLTAMERVNLPEDQRTDFYLYVDEFQNFATRSFIKILSEARKYRLNLILANQYIGQVEEDIQKAIFGNVGTLVTFLLGATDALIFQKEFGSTFTSDDLVALKNYEIITKMSINNLTSEPFLAKTLPLPAIKNENKEKIQRLSLEKYYRKV